MYPFFPIALFVVLEAAPVSSDPTAILILNYGVLGISFTLLIFGKLHTDSEVKNLKETITSQARYIAARDILIEGFLKTVSTTTLPALERTTQAVLTGPPVQQTSPDLERLLRELNDVAIELKTHAEGEGRQ